MREYRAAAAADDALTVPGGATAAKHRSPYATGSTEPKHPKPWHATRRSQNADRRTLQPARCTGLKLLPRPADAVHCEDAGRRPRG
jgi:enhancing lycopene biosynthesis protein 2